MNLFWFSGLSLYCVALGYMWQSWGFFFSWPFAFLCFNSLIWAKQKYINGIWHQQNIFFWPHFPIYLFLSGHSRQILHSIYIRIVMTWLSLVLYLVHSRARGLKGSQQRPCSAILSTAEGLYWCLQWVWPLAALSANECQKLTVSAAGL